MGREVGGEFRIEGTHVYPWPIHVDVWKKPSQYCNYPPKKERKKGLSRTQLSSIPETFHLSFASTFPGSGLGILSEMKP